MTTKQQDWLIFLLFMAVGISFVGGYWYRGQVINQRFSAAMTHCEDRSALLETKLRVLKIEARQQRELVEMWLEQACP